MVFVVVGLVCSVACGEELLDLIKRLEKLNGNNSIHAVVRIEDRMPKIQDKESKLLEKADFVITADANALTLTVAGKISDTRLFREFSLLRAGELVHYGPHLARDLDGLKLVENRAGSHQGVSCRHWRLKSEQKQKQFGVSSTTVRDVALWIDANGYPLAGSFKTQTKGRMLLFKFDAGSTRNQHYQRLGTRLVLVLDKNETDVKSRAGNQKRTVTTTVEVKKD
jgi:hypothetical protein